MSIKASPRDPETPPWFQPPLFEVPWMQVKVETTYYIDSHSGATTVAGVVRSVNDDDTMLAYTVDWADTSSDFRSIAEVLQAIHEGALQHVETFPRVS